MKTTELRVGNWVQDNDGDQDKVDLDILAHLIYYNIEPIPFTEEWAERMEFTRVPDTNKWRHGRLSIDFDRMLVKWDYSIFRDHSTQKEKSFIVHDIQNLYFALTGEELEIKMEEEA